MLLLSLTVFGSMPLKVLMMPQIEITKIKTLSNIPAGFSGKSAEPFL
jgi:hypothetical protein